MKTQEVVYGGRWWPFSLLKEKCWKDSALMVSSGGACWVNSDFFFQVRSGFSSSSLFIHWPGVPLITAATPHSLSPSLVTRCCALYRTILTTDLWCCKLGQQLILVFSCSFFHSFIHALFTNSPVISEPGTLTDCAVARCSHHSSSPDHPRPLTQLFPLPLAP